jgi:hypothetical protein
VRRKSLVASAVLTAVLALGALPDVSRSLTPSPVRPVPAGAFQSVRLSALEEGMANGPSSLDAANESASHLDLTATLIEPGSFEAPTERPLVRQPVPAVTVVPRNPPKPAATARKATPTTVPARPKARVAKAPPGKPRFVLHGIASWYSNGTTAMRLPRGTRVRICGSAGCVTRVVNDYGPAKWLSARIVDLMPGDFRAVSGRSLSAGVTKVTVYIY